MCRAVDVAHIKASVPSELVGTAVTAVNFFLMAGPALVQRPLGLIFDRRPGDYSTAFLAVVLSLLLGAGAYLTTRDTHPSPDGRPVSQPEAAAPFSKPVPRAFSRFHPVHY